MQRVGVLAMCALLSQSGCSALFASIQTHNSRGTSCMDEPVFPAIDLVIGSVGSLALIYTEKFEESPGYLAIPGVFLLSGLIASFTVYACRNDDKPTGDGVARPATPDAYDLPPNNVIPPEERTEPIEPDVRDATLEERGMTVPVFEPVKDDPGPTAKPDPAPAAPTTCRINPLTQCPDGQSCVLTNGDEGFCRPDAERSKPNVNPPKR